MINPFTIQKKLRIVEEVSRMNTNDVVGLAKSHPDVVGSILSALAAAAQADPGLIPDAIGAIETKSYTGFAFKHLAVLLQLVGIVSAKPDLVQQIGTLAKG